MIGQAVVLLLFEGRVIERTTRIDAADNGAEQAIDGRSVVEYAVDV